MTPQETYYCCVSLMRRKKELEKKLKRDSVRKILEKEFEDLFSTKPTIFKNLLSGEMSLEQFKQFAESAQCIMSQMNNPSSGSVSKPPPPVIFD